jgi:hypothetical protein
MTEAGTSEAAAIPEEPEPTAKARRELASLEARGPEISPRRVEKGMGLCVDALE